MSKCPPRVALVRGPILSQHGSINNEATPCIAFAYISSYLSACGYQTTIVDAIGEGLDNFWPTKDYPGFQCQGLTFEALMERIPADAEVIGFSTMFSGEWPINRDLIRRIRERFEDALLVAGGEHASALAEYCLRDCPELDVIVHGEGEQTFHALIEQHRQGLPLKEVGSLSMLDADGGYCRTERAPRIPNISKLPWPDWPDQYMERFWNSGKSYGVASARDMPIMASRGCPYRCTFCSSPQMWTTRYTLRDVDDLIAEIEFYIERYDITALQFYDLTAITKKRWTVAFCKKLIERGIRLNWSLPSGTRSEALDDETLGLLRETGCNYLVYAPESGSKKTLELIKKRIELKSFTRSVIEAKRQGLTLRTNLIIGFPHETRRLLYQTLRYGLYLAIRGVDEVSINIFSPYPGTEIFEQLVGDGKVTLDDRYFLSLTSLNSAFLAVHKGTVNPHIGPRELAFYRLTFMLTNYLLGYMIRPARIIRTLRNVFSKRGTTTVLEHRLRDIVSPGRSA